MQNVHFDELPLTGVNEMVHIDEHLFCVSIGIVRNFLLKCQNKPYNYHDYNVIFQIPKIKTKKGFSFT